jgi:cystathionine beta-lyase
VSALLEGLTHFGLGFSWGGYESLAVPSDVRRTATKFAAEGPVIRIHAGLEDAGDLIDDLSSGFERLQAAS